MIDTPAIELTGVTKRFGPTVALADVSLRVGLGESRALIGRNGAGKSTLISILAGRLEPDRGAVNVLQADGKSAARTVGCVFQHSTLVPAATSAENIALGQFPRSRLGLIEWREVQHNAEQHLAEWGLAEVAGTPVERLGPLERKIVEICRVLSVGPRVLLLDEPTAGLDQEQTERLFGKIAAARASGVTIIYVSHHLQEIFDVCDSVTVLRDGRLIETTPIASSSVEVLVSQMMGHTEKTVEKAVPREPRSTASDRRHLVVRSITKAPFVDRVTFSIRKGECVGLTGLDGAGHFEIGDMLAGRLRPDAADIEIGGVRAELGSERVAIRRGIGSTPPDRRLAGFVPAMTVAENATMPVLSRLANKLGVVSTAKVEGHYGILAEAWEIVARAPSQPTEELSGGNQQKVVLARALASSSDLLVLMNPTAGVDVGAKASIYVTISNLVAESRAVLLISSDDADFEICDRVLVMYRGRLVRELTKPFSEHDLATAAQGPAGNEKAGADG